MGKKKVRLTARQGSKVIFILPVLVFSIFVIFISINLATAQSSPQFALGNSSANFSGGNITQGNLIGNNGKAIRPPVCDLSGFGLIANLFGVKCVTDYIGLFIGLAFISSDFLLLNVLVFLPLGLATTWVILELIRGV